MNYSRRPREQYMIAMQVYDVAERVHARSKCSRRSSSPPKPPCSSSTEEQDENSNLVSRKLFTSTPTSTNRKIFRNTIPPRQPQRMKSMDVEPEEDATQDELSPSCPPPPLPTRSRPFYESLPPTQPQRCQSIDATSQHRSVSSVTLDEELLESSKPPSRNSLYERSGQPSLPSVFERDEENHSSFNELTVEQQLISQPIQNGFDKANVHEVDFALKVMKKLNDSSVLQCSSPPTMPRRRSTKINCSVLDEILNSSLLSSCTFDFDGDDDNNEVREECVPNNKLLLEPERRHMPGFLRMAPTMPHRQ